MNTYRVINNTDYRVPFVTHNKRTALRIYRRYVAPREGAGNLYDGDVQRLVSGHEGDPDAVWESIAP